MLTCSVRVFHRNRYTGYYRMDKVEPYSLTQIRDNKRYIVLAPLDKGDLYCYASYECRASDDYPMVKVNLEAAPNAARKDASVGAMRQIALRDEWIATGLDEPKGFISVSPGRNLATLLYEEDHVAAVKRFFIESIRQLREELTAFKKNHPELLWNPT